MCTSLRAALVPALLLAACGGGGGSSPPRLPCQLAQVGEYRAGDRAWRFALSPSTGRAIVQVETSASTPGAPPTAGLHVVDVSDPTRPVLYGALERADSATYESVAIAGSRAYATYSGYSSGAWESDLDVIDLSTLPLAATTTTLYDGLTPASLALAGDGAGWLVGSAGLQAIDLSTLDRGTAVSRGQVLAVAGDRAYVGDQETLLQVFDLSNPALPVSLGSFDVPGHGTPNDVLVLGSTVAMSLGDLVALLDVSDPSAIAPVAVIETDDAAEGMAASGSHGLLANGYAGLTVVDLSELAHPVPVQSCSTGGYARQVIVDGGYAYVLSNETGLRIFDLAGLE